ncbi:hypothetical protein [Kitasatospora sp. NPDC004289]
MRTRVRLEDDRQDADVTAARARHQVVEEDPLLQRRQGVHVSEVGGPAVDVLQDAFDPLGVQLDQRQHVRRDQPSAGRDPVLRDRDEFRPGDLGELRRGRRTEQRRH